MRIAALPLVACVLTGACALLAGIEETTTIVPADARTDEVDGVDGAAGEHDARSVELDAELLEDAELNEATAAPCTAAERIAPASVDVVPTATGVVCDSLTRIYSSDDVGVGLEHERHVSGSENTVWDGKSVYGCIQTKFAGGPYTRLYVRARAVANACGTACTTECESGRQFGVFWDRGGGIREWISTAPIGTTFGDYFVPLDRGFGTNPTFVVCRTSARWQASDVVIDAVAVCP